MATRRIVASALSIVILALFVWSIIGGVGDLRTKIILGVGALLGFLYAAIGRIPDWIVDFGGGTITHDDDPSNLSPRFYLPILIGVILFAAIAFYIVQRFL
ncbi:MAG: hypothetical protein AAF939_19110 [Planctomycetota bacterium]